MVNKKTRKYYYRAYREKKADLYKVNDAPRKKIERERRKNWNQKGTKCSRRRNSPCQGIPLKKKDVRAITGQYCSVTLRNNINHIFSIFNKTKFESKYSQDRKITSI